MDLATCLNIIFFFSFFSIPVTSRVVNTTSELPLNNWSVEDINVPQNDNSESLEDELQSLHPPQSSTPTPVSSEEDDDSVESFDDEIDDVGQQRERPLEGSEEMEKEENKIVVTTLVPSLLTEENTRVDEPTDREPAEPTKENGSVTSVMSEVQTPSAPSLVHQEEKSSNEENLRDWKQISEEEQLLKVKEVKRDKNEESEDDSEEEDNSEADEDDYLFSQEETDDVTVEREDFAFSKVKKVGDNDPDSMSKTKRQLKEVLKESGLFSRSARRIKGDVNPGNEEEMLEFLIRLSKNPKGWSRISEILGKIDYDTSSRLKTALQMEAMKENEKSFRQQFQNKPNPFITENKVMKPHQVKGKNKTKNSKHSQKQGNKNGKNIPKYKPKNIAVDSKWPNGKPNKPNSKTLPLQQMSFTRELNDPFVQQLHESELKHLSESRVGPINTIAVDIPNNKLFANKYPQNSNNKHAYIAVSVYKPNKENYHKINIGPKVNSYPNRFDSPLTTSRGNKNFAVEKPMIIDSQGKVSLGNGYGKSSNGTKPGRGKNKSLKKGKSGNQRQKGGRNKDKIAKDEIEAQLIALTNMEQKLRQHLLEKEKLRQRIRSGHRLPRSSYM